MAPGKHALKPPIYSDQDYIAKLSNMGRTPLEVLYAAFQRAENRVGGGEGLVGIYGSMTLQGTCSIMDAMVQHAGLGTSSILVDIGSGLCRPLLHACLKQEVEKTFGVELDAVKCQKAVPFVHHVVSMLEAECIQIRQTALPKVICSSVEQLDSLHPATHAYAAWEGFPETAKRAVGRVFSATPSLQAITIVQRSLRNQDPAEVMEELGFGQVECKVKALPVYMAGSGRKLNAYLFVKPQGTSGDQSASAATAPAGINLETAPAFDPSQVISELGRMESCQAAATGPPALIPTPTAQADVQAATGNHHGLRSRNRAASDTAPATGVASAGADKQDVGKAAGVAAPDTPTPSPPASTGLNLKSKRGGAAAVIVAAGKSTQQGSKAGPAAPASSRQGPKADKPNDKTATAMPVRRSGRHT